MKTVNTLHRNDAVGMGERGCPGRASRRSADWCRPDRGRNVFGGTPTLPRRAASRRAFTLIELLVVIAIIAILAALIVGLTSIAGRNKVQTRVNAELNQLLTAIE